MTRPTLNRVALINGPNLNLLGSRRPDLYGSTTLADLEQQFRGWCASLGLDVTTHQSNHEGALIDVLHECRTNAEGIVFNPGAYTHTSYALHDAIEAIEVPTVEVHISNVEEREGWRRHSVVRAACVHTIYGRGIDGYRWALLHLHSRTSWPFEKVSYGPHPDQFVDLRHPQNGPNGRLAVVVHGGFWRHMWTRDTTESLAIDLARRGYVTANVEYRRSGLDPGVGPAEMTSDVIEAVGAAQAVAGIGADRTDLLGHSAGAQLVSLAAVEVGASRTVVMGGVLDLDLATETTIGADAARQMLGSESPLPWSPVRLADQVPGLIVVHGLEDHEVPIEHARRMLVAAGQDARSVLIDGADHFDVLDSTSESWRHVLHALAID